MSAELVKKFKVHMVWQDQREEQWLQQMARQGWHLVRANVFCVYTFEKGAPADVDYRLDFAMGACKDPSYYQLFEDAGWEQVIRVGGWHYWRKQQVGGQSAEIFTDTASQIAKYRRVQTLIALAASPMLFNVFNPGIHRVLARGQPASLLLLGLMAAVFGLMMYAVVRIGLRIRALRGRTA